MFGSSVETDEELFQGSMQTHGTISFHYGGSVEIVNYDGFNFYNFSGGHICQLQYLSSSTNETAFYNGYGSYGRVHEIYMRPPDFDICYTSELLVTNMAYGLATFAFAFAFICFIVFAVWWVTYKIPTNLQSNPEESRFLDDEECGMQEGQYDDDDDNDGGVDDKKNNHTTMSTTQMNPMIRHAEARNQEKIVTNISVAYIHV